MAKTEAPKIDVYQTVTDAIVAALEAGGVRPWVKGWAETGGLQLRENGQEYRGVNQFLLGLIAASMGYTSPYWLTFKQAQADGMTVRKGERGSLVVFTKRIAIKDDATGEDKVIPILKHYTVFNLGQCDLQEGREMKAKYQAAAIAEARAKDRPVDVEAALKATGAIVREGGDAAYYSPALDFVQMPPFAAFTTSGGYVATLAHELVHWTGHKSRCNRDQTGRFGTPSYAREELVAELGAAMACARLGIAGEHIDNHAAYVGSWLKVLRSDKRAIFTASAQAQSAVDFLLGAMSAEDAEPLPLAA